jgi:hypothetical protein
MARDDELVVVEVAGTEPEAELLCSLLRSAGVDCLTRLTNRGAGAGDGLGNVGPHEIVVSARDAEAAREILHQQASGGAGSSAVIRSQGEDEADATDDRGRRWHHLRPVPSRRTDLMGFNGAWWVVLGIVLIVLLVYPFPLWR